VQGVVEDALRQLGWQGKSLLTAGRTDTGVHASGQVIAFDLHWPHPENDLLRALNANLPADVAANKVSVVPADFHPRYKAVWRRYTYRIYLGSVRDPLLERYAWRVWPAPDLRLLQTVAQRLAGRHDFAAFGSPMKPGGSTVRNVLSASWRESGAGAGHAGVEFSIVADAFLYHMVRRLVFFQVEIGQGRLGSDQMEKALSGLVLAQGLAPAQGLILSEVHYRQEEMDNLEMAVQTRK
jgi:tRNA pseudouridine38-40 synthase